MVFYVIYRINYNGMIPILKINTLQSSQQGEIMFHNQSYINQSLRSMKTTLSIILFMLVTAFVCSLILTPTVAAQQILVQTGFEEFTLGAPPTDWEVRGDQFQVSDDTVKTENKSLGILGGANDDRVGVAIDTENPVISVECWVYVKGAGRSFNLKVVSSDNIAENNGGVYMNWNENALRLYDGSAWVPIDVFQFESWNYIRVVADVSTSQFDYYVGKDRDEALLDEGIKGLAFRNAAVNPVAKWVVFHVYSSVAQGFIDDLLIYEGSDPPNLAPVDPKGKLTTFWGQMKRNSSLQ